MPIHALQLAAVRPGEKAAEDGGQELAAPLHFWCACNFALHPAGDAWVHEPKLDGYRL
jgi:ATP-dependent DNA ligase